MFHGGSLVVILKIATIPAGFRWWWWTWGLAAGSTAVYAAARLDNTVHILWYAQTFDLTRVFFASLGGALNMASLACLWSIVRARPRPTSLAIIRMNWEGDIISWDPAATELLGWTADEAVGHELADLLIPEELMVPWRGGHIPAQEAHRRGLAHYKRTGQSVVMNKKLFFPAKHKDGRRIEVELQISAHVDVDGTRFMGQLAPATVLV